MLETLKIARDILHSLSIIGLIAWAIYSHADAASFRSWMIAEAGGLEAAQAVPAPVANIVVDK